MAGDVIGRESELAFLNIFLDSIPTGPSALVLSGDLGIGQPAGSGSPVEVARIDWRLIGR